MSDYYYDSARVRTLEKSLVGRERIEQLLQAKDTDELIVRLGEYGIHPITDASGRLLREETLLQILRDAYAVLREAIEDDAVLRLWLYPYDCNNVKAAIKCNSRKIDPRSMMFDFGTVDVETVVRMAQTNDFSALPPAMCAAANAAVDAFAKSRDPQLIDLYLDRACYADMLSAADSSGDPFAKALVREKIDLTNLLTLVRVLRMRSGEAGGMLLRDALIGGGTLSAHAMTQLYSLGEDAVWEQIRRSERYEGLARMLDATERSLTDVERCVDNFLMAHIRDAKWVASGAEVLIGFLLAHEYEVRNLRILFAGKEAGLPIEIIRERIRESYV